MISFIDYDFRKDIFHQMIRTMFFLIILLSLVINSQSNFDDFVSVLLNETEQKINITCLCIDDEQCDDNTQTCRLTNSHHACYETWTKELNANTIHVTAGCMYNDFFFTRIICDGNHTDRYIICCSDKDNCNDRDVHSSEIRRKLLPKQRKRDKMLFIVIIIIILLSSLIAFILFRIKQKKNGASTYIQAMKSKKTSGLLKYFFPQAQQIGVDIERTFSDNISISSSGHGASILSPRTFAKEVVLDEKIGSGRYGCVYRGKWREDEVAVKIFSSTEEPSWFREVDIYQTLCLSHENILRYIAADNIDISDRIELWLATEYHKNGSVYDYLINHTITIPIMLKMMSSIASGLCHLHLPIDSTNGKVALAHRDLKTKNVLVKNDLSCCIADLGLAVRQVRYTPQTRKDLNNNQERFVIDIEANHRAGTYRYMAPEILDKTLNDQSFESYKAADMYALGLVYWEILRRSQTTPNENDADVSQLPYEDVLPDKPGFEQMYDVICTKKIRPSASPRWENHPIFHSIFGLCQELWIENPTCRPTSYYVKTRQVKIQSEVVTNELTSINIESRIEGPRTV